MTLRKVPGAIALGLLASLAAHAALYGGGHAMGGAYHGLLFEAALGGVMGLLLFFGGLAWVESSHTADGSVLAVRLRERVPGLAAILALAFAWYTAGEGLEPHHAAASPLALAIVLAAASWLVARLAQWVADVLACAAVVAQRSSFVPRTPAWKRRERVRPVARRMLLARRRFARPPPIVVLSCA